MVGLVVLTASERRENTMVKTTLCGLRRDSRVPQQADNLLPQLLGPDIGVLYFVVVAREAVVAICAGSLY